MPGPVLGAGGLKALKSLFFNLNILATVPPKNSSPTLYVIIFIPVRSYFSSFSLWLNIHNVHFNHLNGTIQYLSTFITLCNCHLYLVPEYFITPEGNPAPGKSYSPCPLPLIESWATITNLVPVSAFASSGDFI